MMTSLKCAAAGLALVLTTPALAGPLKLEPANPQPETVTPGLMVQYAYPSKVKSLAQADAALKEATAGTPLEGMDYWDTEEGMMVMTSEQATKVAAAISGFVRFDDPGIYVVDFLSNDGLRVRIGGQQVVELDETRPCDPGPQVEVEVPVAGWYPLAAVYFQNKGTACLHMRAAPAGSAPDWMPNSAFGH